jgi:O-antigen ligase
MEDFVSTPVAISTTPRPAQRVAARVIDRPERVAFGATVLVALFIPWDGIRLGAGSLVNAFLVLAFLATLVVLLVQRRPVPLPGWMLLAGGGLLVSALLTIAFPAALRLKQASLTELLQSAGVPYLLGQRSDLSNLVKWEIAWIVMPLILVINANSRERCRLLLDVFALAAAISAVVALLDVAGFHLLASRPIVANRSSGLTIHPNYLAFESALAVPVTLLWIARGDRWTIGGLIASGALLGGVYSSGSRAAAVGAVLAVAITVVFVPRLRRLSGLALPFVGIAVVALLAFTNAGTQILHKVRLDSGDPTTLASNTTRSEAAHTALAQFRDRPLEGVGFQVIEDAHNIYLQLLAAGGLITFLSFVVYLGGLGGAYVRARNGPLGDEATVIMASLVVWLVGGAFDNQLIDKFLYVMPGLLLAMAHLERMTQARRAMLSAEKEVNLGMTGDAGRAVVPAA